MNTTPGSQDDRGWKAKTGSSSTSTDLKSADAGRWASIISIFRKSDLKQKFDVIAEHSVKIMMAEPSADQYTMMQDFVEDLGKEA